MSKSFNVLFFLFGIIIQSTSSKNSTNDDLVITWDQKLKLDKFKEIMEPQLPHDYMKSEIYLIPWLKTNKFNIPSAIRALEENLSWREKNNMDTILSEDWSDYNAEYRFNIEGCDASGRLLASIFVGEWDFRKAALAGQTEKMKRYIDKIYEEASIIIRNMQADGHDVTRASLILDFSSLSLQLQLCPRCIPFYTHLLQTLAVHYPNLAHSAIAINVPDFAIPFWENLLKPFASRSLRGLIHVYGRNKKNWRTSLLVNHGIDIKNLSYDLGGEGNADPVDANQLRSNKHKFSCPKK